MASWLRRVRCNVGFEHRDVREMWRDEDIRGLRCDYCGAEVVKYTIDLTRWDEWDNGLRVNRWREEVARMRRIADRHRVE